MGRMIVSLCHGGRKQGNVLVPWWHKACLRDLAMEAKSEAGNFAS